MKKQLEQVAEFHKAFGIPILKPGEMISKERKELRRKLLKEEIQELIEAHQSGNIEHIAKEACDLVYVTLGTVLEFGWAENEIISMLSLGFGNDVLKETTTDEIEKSVNQICRTDFYGLRTGALDLILISVDDYLQGMNLSQHFERCFDEVHRSNMSKLDANGKPVYREDGKVLKSELYSPAGLSFLKS